MAAKRICWVIALLSMALTVDCEVLVNDDGCSAGTYLPAVGACIDFIGTNPGENQVPGRTFDDAMATCQDLGQGSLPIIRNIVELDFFMDAMSTYEITQLFIGLEENDGVITWIDGEAFNETSFNMRPTIDEIEGGGRACIVMTVGRTNGNMLYSDWLRVDCAEAHSFACVIPVTTNRDIPGAAVRDPHFMIELPNHSGRICFDLDGYHKEVMLLIHDAKKGIVVNGQLFETPESRPSKLMSYFSQIAILMDGIELIFNRAYISINDVPFKWTQPIDLTNGRLRVKSHGLGSAQVFVDGDLSFLLSRDKGSKIGYYMGFYIMRRDGLTTAAHGVLGQFKNVNATIKGNLDNPEEMGLMHFSHPRMPDAMIHPETRLNMMAAAQRIKCWSGGVNGEGLIQGKREDYIVRSLTDTRLPVSLQTIIAMQEVDAFFNDFHDQ